jgi:adhesin transport system membrane fusion protein
MSLAQVPQPATAGTTRTPPARRRPATQPSLPALVLARPSRFARAVGTGLLLLLLMTPVLLVFVPWTQSVEGSGQVVGLSPLDREFTVESPIYGRVKKWYVSEGSFVRGPRVESDTPVPGDLLAELSNNDPEYLNALVAGQRAIEDKIANANLQAQTYADILEDLGTARERAIEAATNDVQVGEQKIEQVRNELEITKIDRETEAWNLKQYQEASKSGLMTEQQLYQARQKYVSADNKFLKAQLEVKQAEVDLKSKQAKLKEVTAKTQAELSKIETDIQAARTKVAEYQKELAEAESKVRNQSSQNVRAPRDGYIRRLLVNEGVQQLKDDEPIAILTPSSPHLAVELYLDGNDTPLVHPGDPVRLQFEGWPAVQIAGWPGVAVGTFPGKVRLIDASVSAKGKFRLIIEPMDANQWPAGRYLRQGVQAKGWVLLRQVPLGYEFWRRLNAFPPLIASPEPGQGKVGKGSAPLPPGLEDEKEKVKVKRPK